MGPNADARGARAEYTRRARPRHRWRLAIALALAACGSTAQRERIAVFAASSLTEAFIAMEAAYERAHPKDDLQLTFAGSQVLRLQIEQGAPAQVYASANPAHVAALAKTGLLPQSASLASNRLTIITPADNPLNLQAFTDIPRVRRLVIGTSYSPIGQYTRALFRKATERYGNALAIRGNVVSEESNVRLIRAKVELGEADAAIVYRSDARVPGLHAVAIPTDLNVAAEYRIGALRGASPGALRFVQFALSPVGQQILERHGFDKARP